MSSNWRLNILLSLVLFLAFNSALLDIVVFSSINQPKAATTQIMSPGIMSDTQATCSPGCRELITSSLSAKISALPIPTSQTTSTRASVFYIPLGSGTTSSSEWQDIEGAEAVVDTGNYAGIRSVIFEVFLKIPTANGKVFAKLYNVTDKHDVWFSEVSSEGPTFTKKEAVITLDPGSKTYRVMGLSTLKYDANIENARLRITTN